MPEQDDNWFDELAAGNSSSDPLIKAVHAAANRFDPAIDDLALARLKKRLRGEGLLESRAQRFVRQFSPPIASAAVVLLCFSVLLQSGLLSIQDDYRSNEYALAPEAGSPPIDAEVEYFDQASDSASAETESSQLVSPQAAPVSPQPSLLTSRDEQSALKEAELSKATTAREQRSKRVQESRFRAEASRQAEAEQSALQMADDTWSDFAEEAEPILIRESKDHREDSFSSNKQQARIVVELGSSSDLAVFSAFVAKPGSDSMGTDELALECRSVDSCAQLNQLLREQAGWLVASKIAQPGILIVVRKLK